MKVLLSLRPGQPGTKGLVREFGERLVCVRYRYDKQTQTRYKTVELIVEEKEWNHPDGQVYVKVSQNHWELQHAIVNAGGELDIDTMLWKISSREVIRLGLTKNQIKLPTSEHQK